MAGYASDQFYNFNNYEGSGRSINRTSDDNPNFNYPSNRSTPLFNDFNNGSYTSVPIQRGFIKGIYPSALSRVSTEGVKQRRLFFQFNPTTLDRTVSMATSVLNPLLQDPSNLLQPVPGSSDFSFDILFNRESEVASKKYTDNNFNRKWSGSLTGSLDEYGTNTKQSDVSNIGVLADLYVLDSIIGQSITPDMLDFLKDYWNNASTISQTSYDGSDGSASFSFSAESFTKTVKKNYGNAAFLSPLPIRIVFSSLFMVEGFVTTSSVQFIKFTSNYVPTICKVTLNIRALYIGFAKEKAYLTDALDTAVADAQAARQEDTAAIVATKQILQAPTFNFRTGPVESKTGDFVSSLVFNSGSIFEWFNNKGPGNSGISEIKLQGTVDYYGKQSLKQAMRDEDFEWDFSATITITEIFKEVQIDVLNGNKPIKSQVLFEAPLTFKTGQQNKDLTTKKMVENVGKSINYIERNTDKWFCSGKASRTVVSFADSKIAFTFKFTRTLKLTLPSGTEFTESYQNTSTISMNADNAEGRALGLKMHAGEQAYYVAPEVALEPTT